MIIHIHVLQDQVTPEERASFGKDSSKYISRIINPTQRYVPRGWVLVMGSGDRARHQLQSHRISALLLMPRLSQSPRQHIPTLPSRQLMKAGLGTCKRCSGYTFFFPEQLLKSPGWGTHFPSLASMSHQNPEVVIPF